jgi:hypothetical protein
MVVLIVCSKKLTTIYILGASAISAIIAIVLALILFN